MTTPLRVVAALTVLSMACNPPGGGGGGEDCTLTWSGAVSGSVECEGSDSPELLAFGASPTSLNWIAAGEDATYRLTFQYQLPNPPTENSYTGGTTSTRYCSVNLSSGGNPGPSYTAVSRPNASTGSPARGACAITFTSKTDTSSSSTVRFEVHGTATATLEGPGGVSDTVDVTVEF